MIYKKKFHLFVQARYSSTRLEGKVLKKIGKFTTLEILLKRLKKSKYSTKIVVLCTKNKKDNEIVKTCKKLKISFFRGPEENVLKRFYIAAKTFNSQNIVRITADCPLLDYEILDKMIKQFKESSYDYLSNINPPSFPDGLDIEIFNFETLKKAFELSKSKSDKEHVTQYILRNKKFSKKNFYSDIDLSHLRLTLDTFEDLEVLKNIFKKFKNIYFTYEDIKKLYKNNKKAFYKNLHIRRNEGMEMNSGQKMWRRANKIIPGGTMLFSKNPDLFLPKFWPAYFSKSKGCYLWDLDNYKYLDFSLMGVGTNLLGYSNTRIDNKVKKIISLGNMTTLNSCEEILLAEKLVNMHPWSKKVKFTRTGGEAAAVAVRAARAATGNDKIAICGYHGWHDWYLSSNLKNSGSLDNHLMRNLNISGVPKKMTNTTFSFEYNNINQLIEIFNQHKLAAVIMEVSRDYKPKNNFLEKVRRLAKKNNCLLIFDECTSGFRESFGGLHLNHTVNPDLCLFGKALGNGYAINAIIGNEIAMDGLNKTFVSSTFWTERIGYVAGLSTLEEMQKIRSWKIVSKLGKKIKENWLKISKKNNLNIEVKGLDALPKFEFIHKNKNLFKTFITQEFLKKKILASNVIYLSVKHDNNKLIDNYFNILDETFFKISKRTDEIEMMLDGPVSISGLRDKDYK